MLAGIVGSAGVAPGPTVGPEVGAAFGRSVLFFETTLRAESTLGDVDVGSGDRLQSALFALTLSPCVALRRWTACASMRAGGLEARASSVARPTARVAPFGAVVASAGYGFAIAEGWSLRPELQVGVPFVSPSLDVDGRSIWDAPPAFAGLSVAVLGNLVGP